MFNPAAGRRPCGRAWRFFWFSWQGRSAGSSGFSSSASGGGSPGRFSRASCARASAAAWAIRASSSLGSIFPNENQRGTVCKRPPCAPGCVECFPALELEFERPAFRTARLGLGPATLRSLLATAGFPPPTFPRGSRSWAQPLASLAAQGINKHRFPGNLDPVFPVPTAAPLGEPHLHPVAGRVSASVEPAPIHERFHQLNPMPIRGLPVFPQPAAYPAPPPTGQPVNPHPRGMRNRVLLVSRWSPAARSRSFHPIH